jgi:S-formylglutathione hydrolase FrmB
MKSTMIKRLALALLVQVSAMYAGQADISWYNSPLLDMTVPYVVILPHSYAQDTAQGKRFPVLYLLHCAGCDHLTWLQPGYGNLKTLIDSVHFIAVAPSDNNLYGWWLDSPIIPNYAHSRFLVEELKPKIDSLYATLPGRTSTGVAGWSMGGFGALHNIIQHPDVYGSAFSIKGGVDPTLPLNPAWEGNNFGLFKDLGNALADSVNWNAVNILLNIHRLTAESVHLGAYSGRNDAWFAIENRRLDTIMTGLSMPHLFFETDEDHYGILDTSMLRVLRFFDSVLVRPPVTVRPAAGFNARTQRQATPAGNVVWYDIRGRRLAAFPAAEKRHLHNASGIRIAAMPGAVYRVFCCAAP